MNFCVCSALGRHQHSVWVDGLSRTLVSKASKCLDRVRSFKSQKCPSRFHLHCQAASRTEYEPPATKLSESEMILVKGEYLTTNLQFRALGLSSFMLLFARR
jgi:hypothetical protein